MTKGVYTCDLRGTGGEEKFNHFQIMKILSSLQNAGLCLMASTVLLSAQSIQFTGSTSMLPIITDAANSFRETFETWDKVDPSLPAEPIVIYTSGGGSGGGVRAAIDGSAHVGMANRDPREAEIERLGEHQIIPIGIDGIAIAAHKDSPLFQVRQNLTSEEVAKLFAGEYERFRDFDSSLPNRPMALLVRDASGGNTQIMQARILKDREFSRNALQMGSTGIQLRRLESNPNTVAYISSGVIWRTDNVEPFALDGILPTQENLVNGTYPLQRRMNLIIRGEMDPRVRAFIDFLLSPEGQSIVERHDYVPMLAASE